MATVLRHAFNGTAARNAPQVLCQAKPEPPLVLLVEDDDDTRFLVNYMLELRGCRVVSAADGETAVQLAGQSRPDLILMDVSLPLVDGLAATRRIRELPSLERVPIVFLSGHAQPAFRATAAEAGGTDFLTKPFELSQLDRIIEKYLAPGVLEMAK